MSREYENLGLEFVYDMFYMFKVYFVVILLNFKKKNEKKFFYKVNIMKILLLIIVFIDVFYLFSIRGMLWKYYICMFIKIMIFINILVLII